jgi:hypothetical protein
MEHSIIPGTMHNRCIYLTMLISTVLNKYWSLCTKFVCLFVYSCTSKIFSYLATVTITGDKAANLDLCLALTAFSSEGSFTCYTWCNMEPWFMQFHPKDGKLSLKVILKGHGHLEQDFIWAKCFFFSTVFNPRCRSQEKAQNKLKKLLTNNI